MDQHKKVLIVLNELGISYRLYEQPPVFTIQDWQRHIYGENQAMCKNLFLRNQKGDKHFLIIADTSTNIDLKNLAKQLGEKQLSFASEKRLEQYLGLSRGAVSPFGLLNDERKEVIVVIDGCIKNYPQISLHPNVNTEGFSNIGVA
jgi:Ala-tRNA(Pro) deacylase